MSVEHQGQTSKKNKKGHEEARGTEVPVPSQIHN